MWTTIQSFPNYEINKCGIVRNIKTGKILSQNLSTKGYYQINIANKCRKIHRLIAESFIPNPLSLETINHKDGNKLNNSIENLEWMSRSDNVKHSRDILHIIPIPYSRKKSVHHLIGRNGINSNRGKKVKARLSNGEEIVYGSCREAAKELFGNVELSKQINQCIKRKSNSYNKINFEYI